jgi:hypothetical protein
LRSPQRPAKAHRCFNQQSQEIRSATCLDRRSIDQSATPRARILTNQVENTLQQRGSLLPTTAKRGHCPMIHRSREIKAASIDSASRARTAFSTVRRFGSRQRIDRVAAPSEPTGALPVRIRA